MRRIALSWLILCGLVYAASAQWNGCFTGFCPPKSAGAPASYTGPGDIVSGAAAWWGLRAYSSAKRGTKAINVCNVSDVVCVDMLSDATTGALVVTTVGGSDCSVVVCTIKTAYDQSGGTNCTAAVCDVTMATIANRPRLIVSCGGGLGAGLPCMRVVRASGQVLTSAGAYSGTATQPYSVSFVAERTTNNGDYNSIFGVGASGIQTGFGPTANAAFMYAGGTVPQVTANDSVYHAVQSVFTGVTSTFDIDGTISTASSSPGTSPLTGTLSIGSAAHFTDGNIVEVGLWTSAISTGNQGTMNSNQHTFWGF